MEISEVVLISPSVFGDHRGFFMETWRDDLFKANIDNVNFVQDNHSKSGIGVLRGLHYQIRQPQGKLVRVVAGEIFDVSVDIRQASPTFGKWTGVKLSAENRQILWIPPGFAHGFIVLSETAEFVYKCTDYYAPEHERCIKWDDPDIGIQWPISEGIEIKLSDKDKNAKYFREAEYY